jgi:predicted TPR repeat methyltransferase
MSEDWLASGAGTADEARRYYDELAGEYDRTLDAWGYDAPGVAAGLLAGALGAEAGSARLLDAGCGTGLVASACRQHGLRGPITGIDLSPASVDEARRRGTYDEVTIGDLQQPLPFEPDSFDGLLCVGVLTYVPDVEAAWRDFCSVTRPGGYVVFTQRHDLWAQRHGGEVLDRLERDGTWAVTHLSPPSSYLPGNDEFADRILVRYVVARVRG